MTNWENKGEGKQDKEKILILAITYFFCCLLQHEHEHEHEQEQEQEHEQEQLPRVQQLQTGPDNRGTKGCHSHTPLPPQFRCMNRMEQQRGQKMLSVFWERVAPAEIVEKPPSLPIHQVRNKFIFLSVTLQRTIQKHHLIEQTR